MRYLFFILLISSTSHAAKYIVEVAGQAKLVEADGFVPRNSIPAPSGDYVESDLSKNGQNWIVDNSKKTARLLAEEQSKTTAKDKITQIETKKSQISTLYDKIDNANLDKDIKDILKLMIEIQFK